MAVALMDQENLVIRNAYYFVTLANIAGKKSRQIFRYVSLASLLNVDQEN